MYAFKRIKSPFAAASCAPHHRFFMSFVAAMALAVEILGAVRRLEVFGEVTSKLLEGGRVAWCGGKGDGAASSGSTI
jgi:hypothetical protein